MNVGPCILTEQAATTTLFSPYSSMSFFICICPGSAQEYMFSLDTTTFGSPAAYSATALQSTVWAMFSPQWHM
jgi:hypothetical protein